MSFALNRDSICARYPQCTEQAEDWRFRQALETCFAIEPEDI